MRTRLLSWLTALLLGLGAVAPLPAQPPPAPAGTSAPVERGLPIFEYAITFIATAVVLLVVCVPARNS